VTPESPGVILALDGATLGYGRRLVLRDVTLEIRPGEFWCVIGPNASGKTTLLRALLGDLAPLSGGLFRDPILAAPSRIGLVPQHCHVNPTLPTTVREFVGLGLVGLDMNRTERVRRVGEALAKVGLAARERDNLFRLSGGQRQRALVARALARRPSILVLDEPTQELDTIAERQLLDTIGGLNSAGVTVIFVTHQLDIPVRHASHVVFVRGGTLTSGTRDRMLSPEALAEVFGAAPSFFESLLRVS
jgi:ABC-type Mn2+/Zn2+ transport system ATPase subunit